MDRAQIHYEVFSRRKAGAQWTLEQATEGRSAAIAFAEELLKEGRAISVRVTKETLDPATREFQSVTILNKGAPDTTKPKKVAEDREPLCVAPQDLYTIHARERIGRLLDGWLERNRATPFELLHRPDLVEQLEASGVELQHAIQKVAVPEAQARSLTVHELIRTFQGLIERAIEKLLKDFRKGVLPDVDKEGFAAAAERVLQNPERGYLLGAGVAASIAPALNWTDKVSRLLDLADGAPKSGPARALALQTIEQPLAEIMGSGVGVDDLLGRNLDLGERLAAMTRLTAVAEVEALMKVEPSVAKIMPKLSDAAQRLAGWLKGGEFRHVRSAIVRRVMRELTGPRRLKPGDAEAEIDVLRGLAMALTAATGTLLPPEEVQAVFAARSKTLITGDFVESYLGTEKSAAEEVEALIWLVENVIGAANKRQAARYLAAVVMALRFEKEFRYGPDTAAAKLASLARLQKAAGRGGLLPEDYEPIQAKLGDVGGMVEADAKLTYTVARAQAPALHRLTLLLKLANGEAAPLGPAADRARMEALRLMRVDETRAELANAPDRAAEVRGLFQQVGVAA
ncbi:hypothetical protein [Phenylobacterium sp.]|uniref:hypothetical protein n=1 Tax=Phenylobacterium sp. TaxID=1871053 RepID=UPI0035B4EC08